MRHWIACLTIAVILGTTAAAQNLASQRTDANVPRVTTLVLQPSPLDTGKKYTLLPTPSELKAGDAAVFYKEAAEAMPKNMNASQLLEWARASPDKLPQDQVAAFIQQAQPSLELVAQGVLCKDCNWPAFQPGTSPDISGHRALAIALQIKARLEIAQKRYNDAIGTMRTEMGMAKHIGEGPTVIQSLVAIAIRAMTLRDVEEMAQAKDSPNLYLCLEVLPRPWVDVEKPIANELKALDANPQYKGAVREAMRKQMESGYGGSRGTLQRLNADVAAVQCVEALRHYAATHGNKLPTKLTDISDVQLRNDPATGKPFAYRLEGSKAILEVSPPKGGTPREGTRYELTIAP